MAQHLQTFFGIRLDLVRDLDLQAYSGLVSELKEWMQQNPQILEKKPHLYIHRLSFDISPKHFTIEGIENRVGLMSVSLIVNSFQRHKEGIKFINALVGQRLSPAIKHRFDKYQNTYSLEGSQLSDTAHFEEYLATIVHRSVTSRERKVKLQATAYPTSHYGSQILKNVTRPFVTKFDFYLNREVQLALNF
jgi:hypothetical protein